MLQEKATLLALELDYDNFTASNGWLHRFQQRHNIKCSILSGESADVSEDVVNDWRTRLPISAVITHQTVFLTVMKLGCFIELRLLGHLSVKAIHVTAANSRRTG